MGLELASSALRTRDLHAWPQGDGHPVIVLPGFLAGPESTVFLRSHLRRLGLPRPRLAPGPQPRRQPRARRPARGPPARAPRPLRAQGQPGRLERRRHLRPRDGPRPARPHPLGHHPGQPVPRAPGLDPRLDDVPHHEPPPPGADVHRGGPRPARLAAERAHHVHLLAHRRHRRVGVLRVRAGPADREHRGARHPPRLRPRARDPARHRRPPRPARGALDAVRRVRARRPHVPPGARAARCDPAHGRAV